MKTIPHCLAGLMGLFLALTGIGIAGDARITPDAAARPTFEDVIIPRVEFNRASLRQATEWIQRESLIRDPQKRGIRITIDREVLKHGRSGMTDELTLSLTDIPLPELMRYVSGLASCFLRTTQKGFEIVGEPPRPELITKTFAVPAALFGPGARPAEFGVKTEIIEQIKSNPRRYLEAEGVAFDQGGGARFSPERGTILVVNSEEQLELVGLILENLIPPPVLPPDQPKETSEQDAGTHETKDKLATLWLTEVAISAENLSTAVKALSACVPEKGAETGIWPANLVIRTSAPDSLSEEARKAWQPERPIRFFAQRITVSEALAAVAAQAGGVFSVERYAIIIGPKTRPKLITRSYQVPPEEALNLPNERDARPSSVQNLPLGTEHTQASAIYIPSSRKLIVRDTEEEQAKISTLIKDSWRRYYASEAWVAEQMRQARLQRAGLLRPTTPNSDAAPR